MLYSSLVPHFVSMLADITVHHGIFIVPAPFDRLGYTYAGIMNR